MTERNSFNLLLVEDNPGDADITFERLTDVPGYGFGLIHVTSLQDASDTLSHSPIDAVILDLNLPDSQGIETLRQVRHLRDDIAIIVVSGVATEDLHRQVLREGAQDFIGKNEPAS